MGITWAQAGPLEIGKEKKVKKLKHSQRVLLLPYCVWLLMRPIRLPEAPSGFSGLPEIFDSGGVYGAIKRAIIIGNGFAGSENQSVGLVRALGLSRHHSLYVSHFTSSAISTFSFVIFIYRLQQTLLVKLFQLIVFASQWAFSFVIRLRHLLVELPVTRVYWNLKCFR